MQQMSTQLSSTTFEITFASTPSWFSTIRQLVSSATVRCGFTDRDSGQIAMVIDEALSNIYRHGYQGSSEGVIVLKCNTSTTPIPTVHFELIDEAKQVDTDLICSRDLEQVRPGGIGVHLIKTIMDEASWTKNGELGMKLCMMKSSSHSSTPITESITPHG